MIHRGSERDPSDREGLPFGADIRGIEAYCWMAKVALITLYDQYCGGARSIASYLEAHGHECHLIHFKAFRVPLIRYDDKESLKIVAESKSKIVATHFPEGIRFISFPIPITDNERNLLITKLEEIEPDVVGFSILSTHVPLCRELTQLIRKNLPEIPIVWGGIHAVGETEDCFPDADAACTGEGEEALVEYLADPERRDIPGFWFYNRKTKAIVKNPRRRLIVDLDSLPFLRWGNNEWLIEDDRIIVEPLEESYIRGHFRMFTTRNCPFKCSYCIHSVLRDEMKGLGPYVRRRSPGNVVKELVERKKQFYIGSVPFGDEVFVMGRRWIEEFSDLYKSQVNIPFYATCHPRTTTKEMLLCLKKAGLTEVCVGLQSGSHRVLHEIYERHTTNEQLAQLAQWFVEVGFERVRYDMLTYCEYETEDDCRQTLEFLGTLPKPFDLFVFGLVPFSTSKIVRMNHPKGDMNHEGFFFYHMLYLLTRDYKVSMDTIRTLSYDRHLRERPLLMADLVQAIQGKDDVVRGLRWQVADLESRINQTTWGKLFKQRLNERLPSWLKGVVGLK